MIKIKQVVSRIGCSKNQKKILSSLGLKKRGNIVKHKDNAAIRGMIKKVLHLVNVEK